MKKFLKRVFILAALGFIATPALAETIIGQEQAAQQTVTKDINNDGTVDVTYYHDGKYINKAEADTNYDGKPDVTVYAEEGKFKSAEADTDHDGEPDKQFSDAKAFNDWVNQHKPEFKGALGWSDWTYTVGL
ncbi:MAG: hypothetical protein ACOY3D_05085 [Candidatus Omnitrophota bacterium]